jgi:hypothetical protein
MWDTLHCTECHIAGHHSSCFLDVFPPVYDSMSLLDCMVTCQSCSSELVGECVEDCIRHTFDVCGCIPKETANLVQTSAPQLFTCSHCKYTGRLHTTMGNQLRPTSINNGFHIHSRVAVSPLNPTRDNNAIHPPVSSLQLRLYNPLHKIALGLNMLVPPQRSNCKSDIAYVQQLAKYSKLDIDNTSMLTSDCQMGNQQNCSIYNDSYVSTFYNCHAN